MRPQELTVDFVLHGEGPASTWAAQAQVGQPMLIAGPGAAMRWTRRREWLLIAGDESAIPAVATILEVVPEQRSRPGLLEVNDAADEFAIARCPAQCQHPLAAPRATAHAP